MSTPAGLPRHWLLRALRLETNRSDGAAALAREAVQAFREAVEEAWTGDADPAGARAQLEAYAERLRRAQPAMAPVRNAVAECAAALDGGREAALAAADAVLHRLSAAREGVIHAADALLRPGVRVLTLSYSETVLAVLTRYADRLERVTCCESRPLNEGARLAAALGELALPVRLITEAQLELFVPECDLALVGADQVLPDGSIVNKAGTALLARVCAAYRVPVYVLADRSKWAAKNDASGRFARERRSPAEVLPEAPRGVEVVNIAFDLTPASLLAGYVTEEGILTDVESGTCGQH